MYYPHSDFLSNNFAIRLAQMRFWLAKSSEVPLREQLEAQVILGIVSNDLKAGQRLPSTRELARRYKIHSNTVSAAYRRLSQNGWVEFRKGSGVYVRKSSIEQPLDSKIELDHLVSVFLRVAREKGFSLAEIQTGLRHWLSLQPPDHFLVIEPDPELRRILVVEVEKGTGLRTVGAGLEQCASADLLTGAAPVCLLRQAEKVRGILPREMESLVLHSRSVSESLAGQVAPPSDTMIAIVSRWTEFLRWSRTILVAAGLDAAAISFRDAREKGWQRGLRAMGFVITDSVAANELPNGCDSRVFTIVSDSSMNELREFADRFIQR
jgi:GntR family transcriptional regulator